MLSPTNCNVLILIMYANATWCQRPLNFDVSNWNFVYNRDWGQDKCSVALLNILRFWVYGVAVCLNKFFCEVWNKFF